MNEVISEFVKYFIIFFKLVDCDFMILFIDFMFIIICVGKNKIGKVVIEIVIKGYCFIKNMYYFGIKFYVLVFCREGIILFFEMIILLFVEENDLIVFKREVVDCIINRDIFVDKIYLDFFFWGNK